MPSPYNRRRPGADEEVYCPSCGAKACGDPREDQPELDKGPIQVTLERREGQLKCPRCDYAEIPAPV